MEERKRIAVINYKRCMPEKCNFLCVRICPVNKTGKECIRIENDKPVISEILCTACKICVHKCPFKAISIINLSPKLGKAVHCYGKNMFRLYGLPMLVQGAVVGLIGQNGIGKTTAMKLLAGLLVPKPDCEHEGYEQLIEMFKGKELQNYLEALKEKRIKASIKPQNISMLAKVFKGTVAELLREFSEDYGKVVEEFELNELLDRKLSELSGGELQKVAIACAILKNADFYFFDEPSAFLDVKERLHAGKAIRELAEKQKYVLVIEHDLALLDYLSDYVHVLFGKKHAYGAISSRLSVLNGINQYLEGFLKNENIRFRDKPIVFAKHATASEQKEPFFSYESFTKSYNTFKLEAKAGTIRKGEIIGIIGQNGIGKSTFVKVLAGIENDDENKLRLQYEIAYKEQYIFAENEGTAREYAAQQKVDSKQFKLACNQLALNELLDRKLSELSGGELQKLKVAITLSKEAELYLLDEPSAFLDVEERLRVASFIKSRILTSEKACFVVDHDLVFIDYLSDRMILFSGEKAKHGLASKPMSKEEALNAFLKELNITFRRDAQTNRPRANKPNSEKDREQKKQGKYFYG